MWHANVAHVFIHVQVLRMCEGIESMEMKEVYYAPYEKEEQLIGANPCTRGPAYWCATVENAVDCNVRKWFPFSTCTR